MTPPIIHGLTVCVGYADLLRFSIRTWLDTLDSLTVVTTHSDSHTTSLCRAASGTRPFNLFYTDAFYRNGAAFNKGLAINEALNLVNWNEWVLFFDADICPPQRVNWTHYLPTLDPRYLYGCRRHRPDLSPIDDDRVGYGYFQLFHSSHPVAQRRPLMDSFWRHAGNSDSNFLLSFGDDVRELPIPMFHLGDKHENWYGVGRQDEYRQMQKLRGGLGIHPSERLPDV